jgi:hypothetical protein
MKQTNRPLGPVAVCLISAASAAATTLVLRVTEAWTSAPDRTAPVATSPDARDDLRTAVSALRAEIATMRDTTAPGAPTVEERTPAEAAQRAGPDVHTHLASLEAQIAQLLQAQKDGDLRTKLVASRHQRQMADEQSLARRLDARAKEHSLSADQAEAMRQLESKWLQRDTRSPPAMGARCGPDDAAAGDQAG